MTTRLENGPHADKVVCEDCHQNQEGSAEQAGTWAIEDLNGAQGQENMAALCMECHTELEAAMPDPAASGLSHQDAACMDCHEPHKVLASCTDSGCHTDIRDSYVGVAIPEGHTGSGDENFYMCGGNNCHAVATQVAAAPIYHQSVHQRVECYACHDASGLDIVLSEEGMWTTALPGQPEQIVASHTIQNTVQCDTCHYSGNPWELHVMP